MEQKTQMKKYLYILAATLWVLALWGCAKTPPLASKSSSIDSVRITANIYYAVPDSINYSVTVNDGSGYALCVADKYTHSKSLTWKCNAASGTVFYQFQETDMNSPYDSINVSVYVNGALRQRTNQIYSATNTVKF